MLKASQDTDVVGLVDDGLDPQRPALLQVLLDAGVLVGEVHLHLGARAKDPGAEGLLGGGTDLAGEQDRDLLGPADTDVVGHQGLKEPAGSARVVKDDRAASARPGAWTTPTSTRPHGRCW